MQKARTFFMAPFENATLALLRVMAGLLFMQHGAQKLFGVLGGWRGEPGATAPLLSQAGLAGVLVPVALERFGADPAVASSVFVTMVTDSMGFLAFLGLAVGTGLVG